MLVTTPCQSEPARRRFLRSGTLGELLLVAAASLHDVWTLEDATVQATLTFPELFSCHGHPGIPDTHRVHGVLYGARGLLRGGLIERANGQPGHPWFRLTAVGRAVVEQRRQKQAEQAKPQRNRKAQLEFRSAPPGPDPSELPTNDELEMYRRSKHMGTLAWMKRQTAFARTVSGRDARRAFEQMALDEQKGTAKAFSPAQATIALTAEKSTLPGVKS